MHPAHSLGLRKPHRPPGCCANQRLRPADKRVGSLPRRCSAGHSRATKRNSDGPPTPGPESPGRARNRQRGGSRHSRERDRAAKGGVEAAARFQTRSRTDDTLMRTSPCARRQRREMRIIAVDAAPGKASPVFDGKDFVNLNAPGLRAYLDAANNRTGQTLLCWDAPLTGPGDPAAAGTNASDFTQRIIEQFFSRAETGFKVPGGISVRPYGGCSHWTISRSLLGLPRTGPYDHDFARLPFHLLPGPDEERAARPCVVEIHPAVAAWLWCRDGGPADGWEYKKNLGTLRAMWSIISSKATLRWANRPEPSNDDEFDAAVGYLLGATFLRDEDMPDDEREVMLLGDRRTGALLVPAVADLAQAWRAWIEDKAAGKPRRGAPS